MAVPSKGFGQRLHNSWVRIGIGRRFSDVGAAAVLKLGIGEWEPYFFNKQKEIWKMQIFLETG